ncbi:MAG: tRNA (guanosine(46)-N7)-methyltransferase TrmB [Erysipelotrichia bacterium]|nr:tRNA (guanosine(46)-N7)-methyltransferase TrmB [Erysipelotrichia bacterium]
MRMRFKAWAEPYLKENEHLILTSFDDLNHSFQKVHFEIGAGKGDFLVESALFSPNDLFIGIEISKIAAAITLKKIIEKELKNVYLFVGDVEDFFLNCSKNVCDYLYLNFPDPWPKARHEKRRLTSLKKLHAYYDLLKEDGELLFKTDNYDLYMYSLETFNLSQFIIKDHGEHFLKDESVPQSAYEKKFRHLGQTIYFLKARRKVK